MKDPGEPVATIVTEYVPAAVELRVQADETLALAEIVTATVGQVTVRPVEEEVPVKVTFPEKLSILEIWTGISPVAPELKSAEVFADISKPPTVLTNVALRVTPAFVAVISTM